MSKTEKSPAVIDPQEENLPSEQSPESTEEVLVGEIDYDHPSDMPQGKRNRRFLLVVFVSMCTNLKRDGSVLLVLNTARDLVDRDNYCYLLFPDLTREQLDSLPKIKNCMYLTSSQKSEYFDMQAICIDSMLVWDLFNVCVGKYHADAAIVFSASQVIPLRQSLGRTVARDWYEAPIYCVEQGASWYTSEDAYDNDRVLEKWRTMNMAKARPVVISNFDYLNWKGKMENSNVSAKDKYDFAINCRIGYPRIDVEHLTELRDSAERHETPTFLWAARTNAIKDPKYAIDTVDELYKEGLDLKVLYLTQTTEIVLDLYDSRHHLFAGSEYIEVMPSSDVDNFYEQARKTHVYVCCSKSESYNSSFAEAAFLGNVVLCKDTPQFRALYPEGLGGDIFWIDTPESARSSIKWCLENYEEAYAMQQPFRDWLASHQEKRIGYVIDEDAQTLPKFNTFCQPTKSMGYVIMETARAFDTDFTENELLVAINHSLNNFLLDAYRRYRSKKHPSNRDIREMLINSGEFIDLCNKRTPVYRKVK